MEPLLPRHRYDKPEGCVTALEISEDLISGVICCRVDASKRSVRAAVFK